MEFNCHYLDAPAEKGSMDVLRRLGLSCSNDVCNVDSLNALPYTNATLSEEHKSQSTVFYLNKLGNTTVDIRDSADCWLRISVPKNHLITITSSRYHRVFSETSVLVFSETEGGHLQTRYTENCDNVLVVKYHNIRELVCELCVQFFEAGWVTGTGGSISIRHGERIYMTPSGVQKERIQPDELYVLGVAGEILAVPTRKPGCRDPKLSDCAPLFLHAFQQRNAGAVLHSHAICCNLVTSIFEGQSEFRISHQEMIKGINGYGYFDDLVIPIIENTAWEHELADSLGETIARYPKACAVLVRRHGMYVWGDTWEQAKRHGECLHYLFEVAINMQRLGMDFNSPPKVATSIASSQPLQLAGRKRQAVDSPVVAPAHKFYVFDIEGTTTPITFVKDTLFPFARDHVDAYLRSTWADAQTVADVESLWISASTDPAHSSAASNARKESIEAQIVFLVGYVHQLIQIDSKIGALKQLQGHIWSQGYSQGILKSIVYDDVSEFFASAKSAGATVAIYSSGSREAQKLLFKHSNSGDLRKFISAYFDTSIGNKRESKSYHEIALTLGADSPSDILFITDIVEEAIAASQAGLSAAIAVRPGNHPVNAHNFISVHSFRALPL